MLRYSHTRSMALVSLVALTGTAVGMGALLAPGIEREGSATHIAEMREMECTPFDTSHFDGLTSWTKGEALNVSSIEGKVVLVGFVHSSEPKSWLTLSTLARYERQNAKDGLVVLAVHPDMGWDEIQSKVDAGRVRVQVAQDPGAEFTKAMKSDDAPDLYLIDRAGQLRYADIESKSLKTAVGQLLRETPDQAIENAKLQSQGLPVADAAEQSTDQPTKKVIPSEAYANASWPAFNRSKLSAKDFQGKPLPKPLGNEQWLSKEKPLEGKVLILDFWATWCGPCRAASPKLEEIQREYEGKLEVLAIGGSSDDERTHKSYVFRSPKAYSNLYDKDDTINNAMEVRGIPHTVVMSTDGVIRWQGNPLQEDFKDIVKQVVESDPMFDAKWTSTDASGSEETGAQKPVPSAYANANWPAQNTGELYASNHQGSTLPVPLGNEKWLSEKLDTEGKVIMLDFWATWCGPCKEFSPIANKLQVKHRDKLAVLAISGQNDSESKVQSFIDRNRVAYSHLYDQNQSVYKSLGVRGIPHVVLLSTDGVIRWQGYPMDPSFERTLEQILDADPMLND
jgi:cytochrome c biogenesis protein CcmG/thiol:disulfide interchange protein DsbE